MCLEYSGYNHKKYVESHRYINRKSIFKDGDWVVPKDKEQYNQNPVLIEKVYLGEGKYPQQFDSKNVVGGSMFSIDYELWVPKKGDLCIFNNLSNPNEYKIIPFFREDRGVYIDLSGEFWDIINPLIFTKEMLRKEDELQSKKQSGN